MSVSMHTARLQRHVHCCMHPLHACKIQAQLPHPMTACFANPAAACSAPTPPTCCTMASASSGLRVTVASFQLDGLRLSRCFTSRWEARTWALMPAVSGEKGDGGDASGHACEPKCKGERHLQQARSRHAWRCYLTPASRMAGWLQSPAQAYAMHGWHASDPCPVKCAWQGEASCCRVPHQAVRSQRLTLDDSPARCN